jgi:hypothetical protein
MNTVFLYVTYNLLYSLITELDQEESSEELVIDEDASTIRSESPSGSMSPATTTRTADSNNPVRSVDSPQSDKMTIDEGKKKRYFLFSSNLVFCLKLSFILFDPFALVYR